MAATRSRYHLLDEIRGFCILLMVVYHAFYTLATSFGLSLAADLFNIFRPVEPLFAGIFILLSGFSCRLSKNNLKRGLLLAAVAVALSVFLWFVMPSQMIWFGILHCLAACILLFALLRKALNRIPTWLGVLLSAALFALTWGVPYYNGGYFGIPPFAVYWPIAWQQVDFLLPFGMSTLYTTDLFPLFPWFFCFLAGTFLGNWKQSLPKCAKRLHIRPLAFMGRYSLWIYLFHQPVIYGLATLIDSIL